MLIVLPLVLSMAIAAPPGVVIDHQGSETRQYIGSPITIIVASNSPSCRRGAG